MTAKEVFESKLVSTVAGVSITVFVGNYIVGSIQSENKKTELAVEALRDHLREQRRVVDEALDLFGEVLAACEGVYYSTSARWDLKKRSGESAEKLAERQAVVDEERIKIQKAFNESSQRWNGQSATAGHWIEYFTAREGQQVSAAWGTLAESLDKYCVCVSELHVHRLDKVLPESKTFNNKDQECTDKRGVITENRMKLSEALLELRRYDLEALGLDFLRAEQPEPASKRF